MRYCDRCVPLDEDSMHIVHSPPDNTLSDLDTQSSLLDKVHSLLSLLEGTRLASWLGTQQSGHLSDISLLLYHMCSHEGNSGRGLNNIQPEKIHFHIDYTVITAPPEIHPPPQKKEETGDILNLALGLQLINLATINSFQFLVELVSLPKN